MTVSGLTAAELGLVVGDRNDRNSRSNTGAEPLAPWSGGHASHPLIVLGIALATLSAPFAAFWQEAHAPIPDQFRNVVLVVMTCAVVAASVGWLLRLISGRQAIAYSAIVVSGAVAVAIAASSRAIIAEGQVTAMVLPVALCGAITAGLGVTSLGYQIRGVVPYAAWLGALVCLAAFGILGYELPVVQFRAGGQSIAIYSVYGGATSFGVALLTGLVVARLFGFTIRNMGWLSLVIVSAVAYLLQAWFGVANAALGVAVSYAIAGLPRREP